MEEGERAGQESQPEPEMQPVPEEAGQEEQPETETQPVSAGETARERAELERDLQPAPASTPGQTPSTERRRQFLIGLGIGLIPLVLFFIGFAPNVFALIIISLFLLLAVLIASLVCMSIPRVRYIGYGLLTSIPISLVVGSIGCSIIISRPTG